MSQMLSWNKKMSSATIFKKNLDENLLWSNVYDTLWVPCSVSEYEISMNLYSTESHSTHLFAYVMSLDRNNVGSAWPPIERLLRLIWCLDMLWNAHWNWSGIIISCSMLAAELQRYGSIF